MIQKSSILMIILLALTACFPVFFRLNLSGSNYEFLDILYMVPVYAWVYLTVWSVLLCLHIQSEKRVTLLHVLLLTLVVYGLYPLSQYPTVIHGDAYYHGISTSQVVSSGITEAEALYPRLWPGAFALWACFSEVSGLDLIDTNFLMTLMVTIVISVILYRLGTRFMGRKWGGLAPLLYIVALPYGIHQMARDHFSPFLFAFCEFLFAIYFLSRIRDDIEVRKRAFLALTLLVIITILLSHSFTSFFIICVLIGLSFSYGKRGSDSALKRLVLNPLTLFTLVFGLTWWIFNSVFAGTQLNFDAVVFYFLMDLPGYFLRSKITTTAVPVVQEPLPLIGTALRDYYLKPIIATVGLLSIIVALRYKKNSFFNGVLLGSIVASSVAYTIPAGMGRIVQLDELLIFTLFPASYLATRFLAKTDRRARMTLCIIPILTLPTFLTMFTYGSEYSFACQDWEINGCRFAVRSTQFWQSMVTDRRTQTLFQYFDEDYMPLFHKTEIELLGLNETWFENPSFLHGIERESLIIRSFQQELTYSLYIKSSAKRQSLWSGFDCSLSDQVFLFRIYDSKFVNAYYAERAR